MTSTVEQTMRFDLQLIASWIKQGSKVLDLGCGEGDLLLFLRDNKDVLGTGIELEEKKVSICIQKGLSVLQGDINEEVRDYKDKAFDYIILSQTLQQVYEPDKLLDTLLRIGKKVIVSFPNFSHWSIRLQVFFNGVAPKNNQLPYEWYNTPNIRIITIQDFRRFARKVHSKILKEVAINTPHHDAHGNVVKLLSNIRATYGIFLISRD